MDPDLKAEEQEKLVNKIKQTISEVKGELNASKDWGKKQLAYPISKKTEGVFWLFEFSAPGQAIASIRQKLQTEEKIIRYLLTNRE